MVRVAVIPWLASSAGPAANGSSSVPALSDGRLAVTKERDQSNGLAASCWPGLPGGNAGLGLADSAARPRWDSRADRIESVQLPNPTLEPDQSGVGLCGRWPTLPDRDQQG